MDESGEKALLTVGVIYAGYLIIIKPLTSLFGASPEEKAAIDSVENTTPVDNPFNSQYQPFIDYFNNFGSNGYDAGGNPVTYSLNDYNKLLKQQYDTLDPVPALDLTSGNAINIAIAAEAIYSAFGFFHFMGNRDLVNAVFGSFTSKAQVAAVDAYLKANYGTDLWTFLKNGAGGSFRGMGAADLAAIVNKVNALPDTN